VALSAAHAVPSGRSIPVDIQRRHVFDMAELALEALDARTPPLQRLPPLVLLFEPCAQLAQLASGEAAPHRALHYPQPTVLADLGRTRRYRLDATAVALLSRQLCRHCLNLVWVSGPAFHSPHFHSTKHYYDLQLCALASKKIPQTTPYTNHHQGELYLPLYNKGRPTSVGTLLDPTTPVLFAAMVGVQYA
jgi:hypothetical protein